MYKYTHVYTHTHTVEVFMYNLLGYMQCAHLIATNMKMSQQEKDLRLANIMAAMERHYKIPMLRDCEWEKHNQGVIITYRAISNMRKL